MKKLQHHFPLGAIVAGTILIIFSLFLNPYSDIEVFHRGVIDIQSRIFDSYPRLPSEEGLEEYGRLRESLLSPKYLLQDYGVMLLFLGGVSRLLLRRGKTILSPKNKEMIVILAFTLPIVLAGTFFIDTGIDLRRGLAPPWADSPGIAFMDIPLTVVGGYIFILPHLVFLLFGKYKQRNTFKLSMKPLWNVWLYFWTIPFIMLFCIALVYAMMMDGICYALFIYFFLSLVKDPLSK